MDDGTGGGAVSGTTLRVGSGNAGALRLLFALLLLFSFAFGLAFTVAGGAIVPPEGNPSSAFPVGGDATCAG